MSASYIVEFNEDLGSEMHVDFTTRQRDVVDYAVLLTVKQKGEAQTVRLYDAAHGVNEMHRYTRMQGKQPAEVFHRGTLGEGMRAAADQIQRTYPLMIEAWQAR
jgi:hypothetical protein